MDTGMLWFDDGPQALKEKVERAVSFYSTKYGRTPTLCLVHPATLADGKEGRLGDVTLRSRRSDGGLGRKGGVSQGWDLAPWRGKRVVVVGLARQGKALARHFAAAGARVAGTDPRAGAAPGPG